MHENCYTETLHWSTTGAGVKLRERDGNGNKIHESGWEREEKSWEREWIFTPVKVSNLVFSLSLSSSYIL
jgi:hypothetical protein